MRRQVITQQATALLFGALTLTPPLTQEVSALPIGPQTLCERWAEEGRPCAPERLNDCSPCHTLPPARDAFGAQVEAALWPGDERPSGERAFREALLDLLPSLEGLDADGDGHSNLSEWRAGSDPGDSTSAPQQLTRDPCERGGANPDFDVCGYDHAYAFKKLTLDVCGRSPTWEELQGLLELELEGREARLHEQLDLCLTSPYWIGQDGALWRLAHAKIRPIQAIKAGEGEGPIPLADYDPDYALFVYAMSGERDVRDLITATYFVTLTSNEPPTYEASSSLFGQMLFADRRAGLISSRWFFVVNTMFTPIPRTTAAQAYRAYLGLDIAKSQGLVPPPAEAGALQDYDDKGVTSPACASCHTTLDPLSYPFSRYDGITGFQSGSYRPNRLSQFDASQGSRLDEVPERGYLFGQPVGDLVEWAELAANSDEFLINVTSDLWGLMIGRAPQGEEERAEFERLWRGLRERHDYRVEGLLHELLMTNAYGRP